MTLADRGQLEAAAAAGREFASNIDPKAVQHVEGLRRRRHVHLGAVVAVGIALGAALWSVLRARGSWRGALRAARAVAPLASFFLFHVALVGGYLASIYENSNPMPFVLFAALMLPTIVIARMWSAVGSTTPAARVCRGILSVMATFAIGFLVVEQVNPVFLEGFGL
jgi:hypothetical protein